jgi:hypothetical protein
MYDHVPIKRALLDWIMAFAFTNINYYVVTFQATVLIDFILTRSTSRHSRVRS